VKSRVLVGRLLSSDDYWSLLESDTVDEIAQKLRSTSYEDSVSSLPLEPHRQDVEFAVKTTILKEAENFAVHMSGARRRFFLTWVGWHEAENLKSIFRYISAGRTDRDALRRRLYIMKSSKVSYDNVLLVRDFAGLAESLKGTPYYAPLLDPLRKISLGEEQNLFLLETSLDGFNELSLFSELMSLDADERRKLLPLFGARLDLFNIYILYRALTFYELSPEEMLNLLLPVQFKINLHILGAAIHDESFEDTIERLRHKFAAYADIFESGLSDESPQLSLERNIKRHLYRLAHRIVLNGAPGFHTVMGYFFLKECEVTDIIRITEAVRYGYDRRLAAAYLSRPIVSGGETTWQ
jgi:V/A-type H+-transporting ATPase subunit C